MQLFARLYNSRGLAHDFTTMSTIGDLKEWIFQSEGIRPDELIVTFMDRPLQPDYYTLKQCGLNKHDTVRVLPPKPFLPTELSEFLAHSDSASASTTFSVVLPHFFYLPVNIEDVDCPFWPPRVLSARKKALQKFCALFKGHRVSDIHWYLRSTSPSSRAVWTPETDHHWPLTFRVVTRYIAKIQYVQIDGLRGQIPLDVAGVICGFL